MPAENYAELFFMLYNQLDQEDETEGSEREGLEGER